MKRKGDTVRYTVEEIDAMLARGDSRTDWASVKGMTEEELEASIAADPDDVHAQVDWRKAVKGFRPLNGTLISASMPTRSTGSSEPDAAIKRALMTCCAPLSRAAGHPARSLRS